MNRLIVCLWKQRGGWNFSLDEQAFQGLSAIDKTMVIGCLTDIVNGMMAHPDLNLINSRHNNNSGIDL